MIRVCKERTSTRRRATRSSRRSRTARRAEAMAQDAVQPWWWPLLMMFGPHGRRVPNTAELLRWGSSVFQRRDRQRFIKLTCRRRRRRAHLRSALVASRRTATGVRPDRLGRSSGVWSRATARAIGRDSRPERRTRRGRMGACARHDACRQACRSGKRALAVRAARVTRHAAPLPLPYARRRADARATLPPAGTRASTDRAHVGEGRRVPQQHAPRPAVAQTDGVVDAGRAVGALEVCSPAQYRRRPARARWKRPPSPPDA
jgi:hypothetical protein